MRRISTPILLTLLFLPVLMPLSVGWAVTARADSSVLPATASRELTVRYFLLIARGHLLASIELAKHGRADQAVIHSRHALDEAWQELARILPAGEAQALRQKIEVVNETVALKSTVAEILAANEALKNHIEGLGRGLLRNGISHHRQELDVIILLLRQAQAEYDEAWNGMQLGDQAEYQDGYGFISIARSELRSIIPELNTENSNAATEIQRSVDQMAHAWPTLQPPKQPAMSKPVLRALVTAVELNSRRFAR
jgi:hypothetical protein